MPRKIQSLPLFPLKHEFVASLDRYIEASSALAGVVEIALNEGAIDTRISDLIKERIEAFKRASYQEDAQ